MIRLLRTSINHQVIIAATGILLGIFVTRH